MCYTINDDTSFSIGLSLSGFQREQINIEVNPKNQIIISGERPSDGSPNRRKRFHKEIRVSPKEYNVKEIDVKFEADCLSIVMPRKVKSNPIFVEQLVSLKHLYRRPEIGKRSTAVQVLVAVSLGMALGVLLALKYSKNSSEASKN